MSKNILSNRRLNTLLNSLRQEILEYFPSEWEDYSHGISHTNRVVKLADVLCQKEGGDRLVLLVAALLHDIARMQEERGECRDHAEKGGELARLILPKYGLSEESIEQIVYCIQNHRSCKRGYSIESKILRDADKLESLGAISVSRIIASSLQSRQYHRPVFNPGVENIGNESASAIHYMILLIEKYKQGEYLFTDTARAMAEERTAIMQSFIGNFEKEWFLSGIDL